MAHVVPVTSRGCRSHRRLLHSSPAAHGLWLRGAGGAWAWEPAIPFWGVTQSRLGTTGGQLRQAPGERQPGGPRSSSARALHAAVTWQRRPSPLLPWGVQSLHPRSADDKQVRGGDTRHGS